MSTPIRYEVDLSGRRQHLVRVRLVVPAELVGSRLVFPTWTPGSYVMRDYVHHLQQLTAADHTGAAVPVHADGHTTFVVKGEVDGDLVVDYELYANELTVRTNHVDEHHALLVAPATFLLVEGARDRVHEVHVAGDDPVWSLLPAHPEQARTWVADDADHLVDSAFEVGDHQATSVTVADVEHQFVWAGHAGAPDLQRIAGDIRSLAEAAVDLFAGDLPSPFYRFLATSWDDGGGGLEHRDGAVLMTPTTTFGDDESYGRFQSLLAHEYLHLWNVKRMTPRELVRPDPVEHGHTTSLWIAEGWTSYYDELLPLRAGLWDLPKYLKALGSLLDGVLERPGARLQSVTQASWHAWTGLYVRDENSVNAGVNYYSHGAVLAWCLDLLIRREQPDGDGLDDALRLLWARFGSTGEGYGPEDVVAAVNEVSEANLRWFFDDHVEAPGLPAVADLVDAVGLEIVRRTASTTPPNLGVQATDDDRGVRIDAAYREGPAWTAGITGGDRLVAIDGHVVGRGQLAAVLRGHEPGDVVDVAVTRGPRLLHTEVTLGEPQASRRLVSQVSPTPEAREAFRRWTGQELPARR